MKPKYQNRVAVIACSGIADIAYEILEKSDFRYKLFCFKAPCLFNIEEKYFEHYFNLASEYSDHILVLLGNCSPYLDKYVKKYKAVKIDGDNCFEFVISKKNYQENINKRTLFVLPGQVGNLKTYLKQMGFTENEGLEMYRFLLSEIIFLNPIEKPFKQKTFKAYYETSQIPSRVIDISLKNFSSKIYSNINRFYKSNYHRCDRINSASSF